MRSINQNARLREGFYTRYNLGSSYFVFGPSGLKTMLCISTIHSTIRETDQMHRKNTEACEHVYFGSIVKDLNSKTSLRFPICTNSLIWCFTLNVLMA